ARHPGTRQTCRRACHPPAAPVAPPAGSPRHAGRRLGGAGSGAEGSVSLPGNRCGGAEEDCVAPIDITTTPEWDALGKHCAEIGPRHLRELFAEDPERGRRMTVDAADLYLDYSKHRATAETVRLLVALAERAGLRDRIVGMFAGEHINVSEDRAVLHTALRLPRDASL